VYFILYIASFLLGWLGAWLMWRAGPKLGFVDHPNERSSHLTPVPKGGGIGILAVFCLVSFFVKLPETFWIPITCIAILSFWGDRSELSPRTRLILQLAAGFFVIAGMSNIGLLWKAVLIFPLTVFVVGTANFYNFMDGINGIAAITGLVAFGLLAVATPMAGSPFVVLALCLALGCLGFLPFNLPSARTFMGDVGSVLLGFAYAALAVGLAESFNDFIVFCAFLFPFYADEIVTMVVRLRDGENLASPHRRHLYQLLANEQGIPHWKVSMVYGIFQLGVGLSVIWVKPFGVLAILMLLAGFTGAFVWLNITVRSRYENTDIEGSDRAMG
jgi:Fuc2NAc and GlcNAc transferase